MLPYEPPTATRRLQSAPPLNILETRADALYTMSLSTSRLLACRSSVVSEKSNYDASVLAGKKSTPTRYNNLDLTTYRNDTVSGKSDFHVDISKSPRGE